MKKIIVLFFISFSVFSQKEKTSTLSLDEYFGYIKKFHPTVKQANLVVSESDLKLLKSRGAFDPKLEVDYANKQFKSKDYYNKLNASFKIPVWYGIDIKASFEDNDGIYLNAENTVPNNGLYSVGISASLGQGLFMNKRMASLKQAKFYQKEAEEKRKILTNKILFDASISYFEWLKFYKEKELNKFFLTNAEERFTAILKGYEFGEKAAIDTLEASITVNNRKLNFEKSRLKYLKSSLNVSNFLWIENNIPVELKEVMIPDVEIFNNIDQTLKISGLNDFSNIENHPKLKSLRFKAEGLEIEKKLSLNKLLPKINTQFNFISPNTDNFDAVNINNYKAGVSFSMPLFLRKERAGLKLNKLKLSELKYETSNQQLIIRNKIIAQQQELKSFVIQKEITQQLVNDYSSMVKAEERKFYLGESSLFYVNTREGKLMDMELKSIELDNSYLIAKAKLYNALAIE
jgi:outer membrane protein TolC